MSVLSEQIAKLYLDVKGGQSIGGLRNCVATGRLIRDGKASDFQCWGATRNTETFYAYALAHVVEQLEINGAIHPIKVICKRGAIERYFKDFVPNWISKNGKNSQGKTPDAYDSWKECYELYCLNKIVCVEKTNEHKEIFGKLEIRAQSKLNSLGADLLAEGVAGADSID